MQKKILYEARSALAYIFSFLPFTAKIESAARFLAKCISNAENHDFARSGEQRALKQFLQNQSAPVLYDIGVNGGQWSKLALGLAPQAKIYGFEMIPQFVEKARATLAGHHKDCEIFNVALSNEENEIEVFQHGGGASVTHNIFAGKKAIPHTVRCSRGDDFVREHNLAPPAYIKIDVEGHELKVLQGLEQTIRLARPVIQFEYGLFYINERVFLKDMFAFFESMDYTLHQIFPTKLVKRKYNPSLENFWTVNYLALPQTGK